MVEKSVLTQSMRNLKYLKIVGHRVTKGYCQVQSRRGSYMAVELEEGDLAKCPARPFHFWALINLSYSQCLCLLCPHLPSSGYIHVSPCSLIMSELISRGS